MVTLESPQQRKLVASLRLLESDNAGERQAALNAVSRLLPQGVTLADLIERSIATPERLRPVVDTRPEPVPVHRIKALSVQAFPELLTGWERSFVRDIAELEWLSSRQWEQLNRIAAKVERGRR